MRRSNAPTLQDVAREAGVTAMTASVVLNGAQSSTRVSEMTRNRILETAERLRYRRNAVARGLSRQRMDTIGVVAVFDGGEVNLYFLEVLNGILEATAMYGQNTTVFSISQWQQDDLRILEFCDGRVDGMILIAPLFSSAFAGKLPQHTPFVALHCNGTLPEIHTLDIDNEGGAYAAVSFLISQGHRRILHFPGQSELIGAQQRHAGYRRALEDAGFPYNETLVLPGNFSTWSGHARMVELLETRRFDPLPTAIFCANDAIAYGCMEVLADYGFRVPEEISVIGFDDTLLARMTNPPLTTVRQPFRRMGRRAVELLLPQIHGEAISITDAATGPDRLSHPAAQTVSEPNIELFATELIIRGSTGSPVR